MSKISKIMDVRMALSLIGGGHGMRYVCRIRNKQVNLFYDDLDGKWFLRNKVAVSFGVRLFVLAESITFSG